MCIRDRTLLVLAEDEQPMLYADIDGDNSFSASERFPMEPEDGGSPWILQTTLQLPFKNALFKTYPIVVQYWKGVEWEELKEGENLLMQSKEAFAKGTVQIEGKKTLVQYGFNAQSKTVTYTHLRA